MRHSEFSPSRLERIMRCPGSVASCATVPNLPTSAYAREGTLLHSYTQQYLDLWPEVPSIDFESEDHEEAVIAAVTFAMSIVDFTQENTRRYQELKVTVPDAPEVYGTLDFGAETSTAVHVVDFKFGRGVKVNAFRNAQLLAYLCGFLGTLKDYNGKELWVHVAQPRISHYHSIRVFPEDLIDFRARLDQAIRLATSSNPPIIPGDVQCRWCDAGGVCKSRLDQLQLTQLNILRAHADLQENRATKEQILEVLNTRDEVLTAIKAVEQYALLELVKGQEIEGFKVVRGRSNRSWLPYVTVESVLDHFPHLEDRAADLLSTPKLLGPAKVEKLLSKEDQEKLKALYFKPDGALSLVKADNPKSAVVFNDPTSAFSAFIDSPE